MPDWKRVHINFPTVKLGQFIEPIKETIAEKGSEDFKMVYGVTNVEGITITGKKASKDTSNYIVIDKNYFAYNPYRINVGSIGFNSKGLKGCVSPAYVVFRAKNNLSPGFLYVYLKSEFGNHLINWYGNRGGVRNALRYDDLCEIDIPDIDYKTQIELLNKIDRSKTPLNSFSEEITQQLGHLKQLRQRILQEAIEGKLTAEWRKQNPKLISGDNHASKLLEKIKAEKERLIKEGKIKKDKPLPPIADDEKPFNLPEGWVWCRLKDVSLNVHYGFNASARPERKDVRLLRITDIQNNRVDWDGVPGCVYSERDIKSYLLSENDIVIARTGGTIGKSFLIKYIPVRSLFASYLIRVIPSKDIVTEYLKYFLESPEYWKQLYDAAWGAGQPNVSGTSLSNLIVPLSPFAEQQAIVDRVNKLMAMIDELEKQASERKGQAEMLMQSVLREAFAK